MIELPKRPAPYILALLVILLGVLALWMFRAVTSPAILQAAGQKKGAASVRQPEPGAPLPVPEGTMSRAMDPHLLELCSQLHSAEQPPEHDLEILEELFTLFRRVSGGNPAGDNADIAIELIGKSAEGTFFPRNSHALRDGQILDRWGTPFWFHPVSASQMEIRSAGPDRRLFTPDDLVLNPSPEGLGASPAGEPPEQP